MATEPLWYIGKESSVTGQIESRIFDLEARHERACKPRNVVRQSFVHPHYRSRSFLYVRLFCDDRFLDLDEFEATLATAGTVQSEPLTSQACWLRCVALCAS